MAILSVRLAALALAILLGARLAAYAAPPARPAPKVEEVKAAYLCSFAEFVDWPEGVGEGPLTLGILGEDPFGPLLEETAKVRALQTKALAIRRVKSVEEAARLRIVYVSASEARSLGPVLRALAEAKVLTVSDIPGFAAQGGIIGFVVEERRVRFEINLTAAERSGLRISSRLLNLARIVEPAPRSRD